MTENRNVCKTQQRVRVWGSSKSVITGGCGSAHLEWRVALRYRRCRNVLKFCFKLYFCIMFSVRAGKSEVCTLSESQCTWNQPGESTQCLFNLWTDWKCCCFVSLVNLGVKCCCCKLFIPPDWNHVWYVNIFSRRVGNVQQLYVKKNESSFTQMALWTEKIYVFLLLNGLWIF